MSDYSPRLVLQLHGESIQEYVLSKASITLGRATTSDVVLRDWRVSRLHARIDHTPEGYEIVDPGSTNGTFVNGERTWRRLLVSGDEVTIGTNVFRFEPGRSEPPPDVTQILPLPGPGAPTIAQPLPVLIEESGVPRLAIHTEARTWEVAVIGDSVTIGRDPGNDVVLDFPAVSRQHAIVERRGRTCLLRDLGSSNGTWIGQERVTRRPGRRRRLPNRSGAYRGEAGLRVRGPACRRGHSRSRDRSPPGRGDSGLCRLDAVARGRARLADAAHARHPGDPANDAAARRPVRSSTRSSSCRT